MHGFVGAALLFASGAVLAHPGHGAGEVHLHGLSPELLVLALLLSAFAVLRAGK